MADLPQSPWRCHDCDEPQTMLYDVNGKRVWNSNGWMHVRLAPGATPVMLHNSCFEGYARDWPLYDGTREGDKDPWGFEDGLWVLRTDYWDVLAAADCPRCEHPSADHAATVFGAFQQCSHCTCTVVMAAGARRDFLMREGVENR